MRERASEREGGAREVASHTHDGRKRLFAFARNAVVRAGAGTGKTEALATVYLHLAAGLTAPEVWPRGGVGPERIVALTFTEKAAREMRERISEAVGLLSAERLPKELESLEDGVRRRAVARWGADLRLPRAVVARVGALAESAARHGWPLPSPERWQQLGWSLGSAQIGTFHGFAAGVLRRAAVDLGVDPAFEVIEQEEADRLLRGAVLGALSSAARRDVNAVVELMATSGGLGERAERGLVSLLSALVRKLEEDGLRAESLEVRPAVDHTDVRTYIVADTLGRFAEACELVPSLRDDGSAERVRAISRAVEGLAPMSTPERALTRVRLLRAMQRALPSKQRTRRVEALADEAREALSGLLQDAVSVVSERLGEVARGVVADAQRRYERSKAQRAGVDFADLMRHLRDALRDRPLFRREWKRRYDAVLVDEFQDTNSVQRDLLYLLRERRDEERRLAPGQSLTAKELEPSGLLVVGDAKQSIYAFRGAEVAVFLSTEQELAEAGGERLELTDSFRAVDTVIDAVNPVAEALLSSGVTVTGLYERARDALSAVTPGDGQARVELLLVPEGRADAQRRTEAEGIARRISSLLSGSAFDGAPTAPSGWRSPRLDEIAVLVPTWSHLEPLKRALAARGIPYTLRGGPGFWERREVDDLVVLLRFVADPSDRMALAALLRGTLVGLSDAGLANLFARSTTLEDLLDPPSALRAALDPDDRERLDEARPTLRRLVRFGPTLGPHGVLRLVLAERGFAAVLARLPFGAQRAANVDKLVGLAAAAERRGGEEADLGGFVQYVDRMRAASQRESEADISDAAVGAVQVLSIHAAKGLEWPVVFVAQTARRRVPRIDRVLLDARGRLVVLPGGLEPPEAFRDLRREAHGAEDDDARRLLYVALTRARDLLVVSGPEGEGEGEGEWAPLRSALAREAPFRVRVLQPGEDGGPVLVRAPHDAPTESLPEPEALADALAPPRVTRHRLALAATAVQDFAWCPRRFQALYELGLPERESGTEDALSQEAFSLARRVLATLDLGSLSGVEAVDASVARACSALGESAGGARGEALTALVRSFAESEVGRAVSQDSGAVMARDLPYAVGAGSEGASAVLTGRIDLVLRGESLGRRGVVVVQYATGLARDERSAEGDVALEVARWALATRFREETGEDAEVYAATLRLGEDTEFEWLRAPERGTSTSERVLDFVRALARARAEGHWEGRSRYQCEGLRCGFIARCHG